MQSQQCRRHSPCTGLAKSSEQSCLFKKFFVNGIFIPYYFQHRCACSSVQVLVQQRGHHQQALHSAFGTEAIDWITDPSFNKVPIILLVIWTALGYELVIYMAALQDVPRDLYEAADIDGASVGPSFGRLPFP